MTATCLRLTRKQPLTAPCLPCTRDAGTGRAKNGAGGHGAGERIMDHGDLVARPGPRAARERWLDALAGAGWAPRLASAGAHAGTGGHRTGGHRTGEHGTGQDGYGRHADDRHAANPDGDDRDADDRHAANPDRANPDADDQHAANPDADDRDGDGVEWIAVADALGRVTAAPVTARWPSPRTDCAAMDGIAVRAADLTAADAAVPAGDTPDGAAVRLPAESFEWIDTGDPMPAAMDTVVVRERLLTQADGGVIITPAAGPRAGPAAGRRNVRTAGEDFAAGQVLVPAGRRLRPADLAAAGAGGHGTVAVAPRPVVAIIPTGDEIRPVGAALRYGDIADTNSLMLAGRCRQLGAVPVVSAVVPDDPDALATELRRAAARADLVLVIAGSSRGRGDHAAAVLAQVGGVAVAGVAVRPGHPALLGHAKRPEAARDRPGDPAGVAPVIGLPGYPISTAVIFELFAVPLLAALQGCQPAADTVAARLDRDWASPADVEDWVLVTLAPDPGGVPLATPARRGAGSTSLLARADAWWPIPAGQGTYPAGTLIEVRPVDAG